MNSLPTDPDIPTVLEAVRTLLQTAAYDQAGKMLVAQIEMLLEPGDWQAVQALLPLFPGHLFDEDPDLRYVEGLVYAKAGRVQEATKLLERARFSYTTHQAYSKAVKCSLELARLCLSRDNFRTAYYYLAEEIQPLIAKGLVTDPTLEARFFLRMAELCPDIGKLRTAIDYAKQAFAVYKAIDDINGQFYALVRLAGTTTHLGDYGEAASKLDLAWSCYSAGNLGANAQARLLNLVIHQNWYQGKLPEALTQAYAYQALVDQEQFSNFRVYARMLLGNLHRTAGQFDLAQHWYAEARGLVAELNYQFYAPWIDAQTAWLRVLEGHLDEARLLIHASLKTSDLGQAISFQVFLAIINIVDKSWAVANRLLRESLTYYRESGDMLSCCALQFYLTLVHLRSGQAETAQTYLRQALGWLAQQHLDGFPHWWHPPLVSEVCAYALQVDIFPDVAERIFVNRLGKAGSNALRALLHGNSPVVHTRAGGLLHLIEGRTFDELAGIEDETCRSILEELIYQGKLSSAGLARLTKLLMTAQQRKTPNPTLLTVFALYVNGYPRTEIAEKIGCSVANVRNYINLLYHIFEIPNEGFQHRRDRQKQLTELARIQKFI